MESFLLIRKRCVVRQSTLAYLLVQATFRRGQSAKYYISELLSHIAGTFFTRGKQWNAPHRFSVRHDRLPCENFSLDTCTVYPARIQWRTDWRVVLSESPHRRCLGPTRARPALRKRRRADDPISPISGLTRPDQPYPLNIEPDQPT